ncbi:hypothetical protein BD289DRAFT_45440 [Coniella lustricola]|uniref:Uncharacterized protein n=1 Tax=Coniella lustricola TaxID=2025994 RepID=A0A2T3A1L0_9PEZI|nr:hypothetical protein BD289DRAFT_45440 [Coniella lustricola]
MQPLPLSVTDTGLPSEQKEEVEISDNTLQVALSWVPLPQLRHCSSAVVLQPQPDPCELVWGLGLWFCCKAHWTVISVDCSVTRAPSRYNQASLVTKCRAAGSDIRRIQACGGRGQKNPGPHMTMTSKHALIRPEEGPASQRQRQQKGRRHRPEDHGQAERR